MRLEVLGSSSSGNCYLLSDSKGMVLVIEAGIEFVKIEKVLNWDARGIIGAIVSHTHNDHAKYVRQLIDAGVDTYADTSVFDDRKIKSVFAHRKTYGLWKEQIGDYTVTAFPAEHDAPCLAFHIRHPEGSVFFITDTMYFRYTLPKALSLAMVEANYDDETLTYNIENGITDPAMRSRLEHSHMEFSNSLNLIKTSERINKVMLIHLSSRNSNADKYIDRVQAETGIPTYIASKGIVLNF